MLFVSVCVLTKELLRFLTYCYDETLYSNLTCFHWHAGKAKSLVTTYFIFVKKLNLNNLFHKKISLLNWTFILYKNHASHFCKCPKGSEVAKIFNKMWNGKKETGFQFTVDQLRIQDRKRGFLIYQKSEKKIVEKIHIFNFSSPSRLERIFVWPTIRQWMCEKNCASCIPSSRDIDWPHWRTSISTYLKHRQQLGQQTIVYFQTKNTIM